MSRKKLPNILEEYCIGCGHCVLACHPGTLKLVNKKSTIVNPQAVTAREDALPLAFRRPYPIWKKRIIRDKEITQWLY